MNRTVSSSPYRGGALLALAAYVAVFPGFWAYHALVAQGLFPPILRGYSVAIAVLVLPLLIGAYLRHLSRGGRGTPFDALFGGAMICWLLVIVAQWLGGAAPAIVLSYLGSIPQWLCLYLIARLIDLEERWFRIAVSLSLAVMSAIVLFNLSRGSFVLEPDVSINDRVSTATYQDFAFIYLITALLLAVSCGSMLIRVLVYLLSTPTLFLVGARTEFVALLTAILLVEWCFAQHRIVIAAGYALFAVSLALVLQAVAALLPENRVVELLVRRADDNSVQERLLMTASALRTIADHPLSGNFGSYRPGEYAHNILSAWVDLGFVGFMGLCVILALPALDLTLRFRRLARDPRFAIALTTLLVSVLLLLGAKFFAYGLTPLALGFYARGRATGWRRAAGPMDLRPAVALRVAQ